MMSLFCHSFEVLAIDFRGYGPSHGLGDTDPLSAPLDLDVLAAVRYLHKSGAKSVSLVGGSMAAARLVMLALPHSPAKSIAW
jgi:pimeloyl-ACP methyl ester carboxylesterase